MYSRRKSDEKRKKIASRRESRDYKLKDKELFNDFHPTILRKPEAVSSGTESDGQKKKTEGAKYVKRIEPPQMKSGKPLIARNHLDTTSLQEFLDPDNRNFYTIGAIGMKNSGKSTMLNLIASGKIHHCGVDGKFSVEDPVFGDLKNGNGIEAFIASDRLILLDSAAVMNNTNRRDFIVSEADDFRQIQALFRLCHELLIVYEGHQLLNLLRMLICAKNMMNPYECDEPQITLVENRVQPGSAAHPMTNAAVNILVSNNISDSVSCIRILDFDRVKSWYDDPMEVIHKLRDDINTRKELKTLDDPLDTEKAWWDKFTSTSMDGSFLVKEFEAMREKFYQPSEILNP